MITYGLIGNPLSHSWSASWFYAKFRDEHIRDHVYLDFPLASLDEFPALIRDQPDLAGLNVTIPYKEKIIPFLDEIDELAAKVGAVNTIRISRNDGKASLKGFNTDVPGFLNSADFSGHQHALVLGKGGAAKAVAFALESIGISVLFVSRSQKGPGTISYDDITETIFIKHTLIVNATPLGTFPAVNEIPPIPYKWLSKGHFLYDLVYNPPVTHFLAKGSLASARTQNGLSMLENQAELSFRIWNE
ncbi:MAG: shikimate dehydrogenase [Bacteroidetes bacterium]|nr:shikimate dehydrogenase [Bacteroidota bacterium]